MSNNDDDLDLESGLGHDPLEWLQDDEEPTAAAQPETAEPQAQSEPTLTAAEPTATEAEPTSLSQSDNELPEPAPLPDSTDSQTTESVPASAVAEQNQQSFRYENHKAFLTVPEKLAIQVIEPMHSEWKTLLYDLPQSIEIDASNTKDVDAAGLQLFYSIVQQLAFKGSDVVIVAVHPVLQRQITLFGLSDFFAQYQHAA